MSLGVRSHGVCTATLVALAAASPAQTAFADSVVVQAAFAPADVHAEAAGISWLRRELIAHSPGWPADRDPDLAFSIHVERGALRVTDAVSLPVGTAVAGRASLRGVVVDFECRTDGSENWRVDGSRTPAELAPVLEVVRVSTNGAARSIDLVALLGNLAGACVADDEVAHRLVAGAASCGEVVVTASRRGGALRVQGRSGGGLCAPAVIVASALLREAARPPMRDRDEWALRAFAGTDGDRAEAVRQMQRTGADGLPVLRSMLHGDEATRLAAIDGIVRLRAAGELPRVARAAEEAMPLAVAMAATAVRELWPAAQASTRAATRGEIARRPALARALDAAAAAEAERGAPRWRALAISTVVLAGLLGFWLRERFRG